MPRSYFLQHWEVEESGRETFIFHRGNKLTDIMLRRKSGSGIENTEKNQQVYPFNLKTFSGQVDKLTS